MKKGKFVKKLNNKGFSMVEIIIVIAIIAILLGLVMPAINYAQAAGRRTDCINNKGSIIKMLLNFCAASA